MVARSQSLEDIVDRLTQALECEAWSRFCCPVCGKLWGFDSFEAYVTDKTHHGMATTMERLQHLCKDDSSVLDMIDEATQRPAGGAPIVDNIHNGRPSGTSKRAALRRLRKDRPDLLERVKAKEMTAHAAMIEAGFRKKPTSLQRAKSAIKNMTDKEREELEQWWRENYAIHLI